MRGRNCPNLICEGGRRARRRIGKRGSKEREVILRRTRRRRK
jgi:hypothetical protein